MSKGTLQNSGSEVVFRSHWRCVRIATLLCSTLLVSALSFPGFAAEGEPGVGEGEETEAPLPASKKKKKYPSLSVSGFIQTNYVKPFDTSDDGRATPDRFRVNKVRIAFRGKVAKRISYNVEVDPRSPTIMGVLRDAFISLKPMKTHEVRIGQQKTVFGYENDVSSTQLYTISRTELSEGPARGLTLRDIGIGLFGRVPLGGGFRLEDEFQVVNGAGMNVQRDNNRSKNFWGRVGVRYKDKNRDKDQGLVARLGISGGAGDIFEEENPADPADDLTTSFKRLGADIEIDHTWFFAAVEGAYSREEEKSALERAKDSPFGYYFLVAGKTPWLVSPLVRYDVYEDWRRLTLGADYGLPDDDLRLLVNYEARLANDEDERGDDRLILQLQVRFRD